MDVNYILSKMTLEEKAKLVSGKDYWSTEAIERLEIPSITMTDGPHGLRKQKGSMDNFDTKGAIPAVAFPSASTTSCSFDKDLMFKMGKAIGEECIKEKVSLLLGPGLNIKRSPLCGRNFEYFSEDPVLSGKMAAGFVNGIQSLGVGACLKHFCANNQETARQVNDSIIDKRALNEIYLKSFKIAIKESNPYAIMCSYNKINGTYACENRELLKEKLRYEYKYTGTILTDWGAMNNRIDSLRASLDLEMPASGDDNTKRIIQAVLESKLSMDALNDAVRNILTLVFKTQNEVAPCNLDYHHEICEIVGSESIVMLKNDYNFFPLDTEETNILMVGEFFKKIRFMGGGSSKMSPYFITNVSDCLNERSIKVNYAQGFDSSNQLDSEVLINEAVELSKTAKKVVLFIGLTEEEESETFDRKNLEISAIQNRLVEEILKVNKSVGVVLFGGSVVNMPWRKKVRGIFKAGLPGEAGGRAIVNVMYGFTNPCAKLSETYIESVEENPSYKNFGDKKMTYYKESSYVGYRYYNTIDKKVVYPFGYGLSYTKFEYSDLKLSAKDKNLTITVKVKNVGKVDGKEVVQIYFRGPSFKINRPEKELLTFGKVFLAAGEEKTMTFDVSLDDLRYYNVTTESFEYENGTYQILVCKDSMHSVLGTSLDIHSNKEVQMPEFYKDYLTLEGNVLNISDDSFKNMLNRELPVVENKKKDKYSINSTFGEIKNKLFGRILYNKIMVNVTELLGEVFASNLEVMMEDMPIRSLIMFTNGELNLTKIEGIVDILNNHYITGYKKFKSKN